MGLLPFLALTLAFQAEPPTATVKMPTSAAIGKPIQGTLTLVLPEGWHGYQNPPAGEFDIPIKLGVADAGFKLGKVVYPKGTAMKVEGQDKPTMVYEGTVTIPFTLVATKAMPKATGVGFKVDYQLCNSSSCLPPGSLSVRAPLKVVAPTSAKTKPKAAKKP